MHHLAHYIYTYRIQKPRTDVVNKMKKNRCNACVDWLSYYAHTWTSARHMDLDCRRIKKPYYTIKCCRARYKVTIEAIYNSYNTPQLYNNNNNESYYT